MPADVTMPELGDSVTEGTVTRWLKKLGDDIGLDEPLLEVSTDKVDTEIPSTAAGVIIELLVDEGSTVEVGGTLARVGEAADQGADPAPDRSRSERPAALADEQSQPVGTASAAGGGARGRVPAPASQVAPRVDSSVTPAGRPPSAATPSPDPVAGTRVPLSRLRQIISQRMTDSLAISAQLTTVQEIDVTRVVRLRQRVKDDFERREGVKLTFLPFFAKAVVETLRAFPAVNASISDDGKSVTYHRDVHLAIAVDTPRGLLVPVVRDAQDLGVGALARKINDVATRTRSGSITADELTGGTFTITNIGSVGAHFDTPIINQPQVAILATGAIFRRPAVLTGPDGEDQIGVRSMCFIPMTYDHRLVDGADAGRFLSAVRARIEEGLFEGDL